jgi:uncharacterized membrane protein (Fun14 family)
LAYRIDGIRSRLEFLSVENIERIAATAGGGFFAELLLGYALKKVIKIAAVILGLYLAGLAFLQYHQ